MAGVERIADERDAAETGALEFGRRCAHAVDPETAFGFDVFVDGAAFNLLRVEAFEVRFVAVDLPGEVFAGRTAEASGAIAGARGCVGIAAAALGRSVACLPVLAEGEHI